MVMTDAGFHATWFKTVNAQGWEFAGRIRGRNRLQFGQDGAWIPARDLYRQARTQRPRAVAARGQLGAAPFEC